MTMRIPVSLSNKAHQCIFPSPLLCSSSMLLARRYLRNVLVILGIVPHVRLHALRWGIRGSRASWVSLFSSSHARSLSSCARSSSPSPSPSSSPFSSSSKNLSALAGSPSSRWQGMRESASGTVCRLADRSQESFAMFLYPRDHLLLLPLQLASFLA